MADDDPDAVTETQGTTNTLTSSSVRGQDRRTWLGHVLRVLVGLLLGVAAAGYLMRDTVVSETAALLRQAAPGWVALAVALVGLTQIVKMLRWRLILGHVVDQIPSQRLWRGLLVGQAVNLLVPARVGDLTRAYVSGRGAVGSVFAFYTVMVEKAWEAVLLLCCLGLLLAWGPWPAWLSQRGAIASLLALLAIVCALAAAWYWRTLLLGWVQRGNEPFRLCLKRLVAPAIELAGNLVASGRDGRLVAVVAASCAVWGLGAATNIVAFRSLGVFIDWYAAILVLVAIYVGAVIPAPPARIGLFHLIVFLSLTGCGVASEQALACAVLLHLVVVLPLLLAGGVTALVADA